MILSKSLKILEKSTQKNYCIITVFVLYFSNIVRDLNVDNTEIFCIITDVKKCDERKS